MQYYSLNHQSPMVNFSEATLNGQAPDKGLYFPVSIPKLPETFIRNIHKYSKEEIGWEVMYPYIGDSIPEAKLREIILETVSFDFPLVKISDAIFSLELFHGPTLAFKDVGARFMSRCLGYFNRNSQQPTTVLVATSGDTGGAVANGFLGIEGVEVIILYPSGKVSPVQELQLTTCGKNITALEIRGSFDDCQALVKQAFTDGALQKKYALTSANSINVARWLPQQLYYFYAYNQWTEPSPPVFSVPSGNFGNICAGMLAHISGLPVRHFIAACNANDSVARYLQTGNYQPKPPVATVSNAMDVGNPSNFIRILELFNQQYSELRRQLSSMTITDETTIQTIREVYRQYGYLLDPHGAVGFYALQEYLKKNRNEKGIFLETAHPVKFPETVEKATGTPPAIPENVAHLLTGKKHSILLQNSYEDFQEWMLSRH